MSDTNTSDSGVNRRDLLKSSLAGFAAGALPSTASAQARSKRDLIRKENAKPGTRDWLLTKTQTVPGKINKILANGRCKVIEGYCSEFEARNAAGREAGASTPG